MGRSNISVDYPEECVFFVDYDSLKEDDDENTLWFVHEQLLNFVEHFRERFPSFCDPADKQLVRVDREWLKPLLENELFCVVAQDNEWSLAVSLRGKDTNNYWDTVGLRKRHAVSYRLGLIESLLRTFDEIGVYAGPYTNGRVSQESWDKMSLADKKAIPSGYLRSLKCTSTSLVR